MPAPLHYRVTFSGVFGSSAAPTEEWNYGVSFSPGAEPYLVRDDLPDVATALKAVWAAHLQARTVTAATLTRVRVASVGPDGLVVRDSGGAYVQGDWDGVAVGTSAQGPMPPQCALTVSLMTDRAGSTGRGRFFVAGPATGLGADLRMDTSGQTLWMTAVKAFLDGLNTAFQTFTTSELVVASGGSSAQGLSPVLTPITSFRIGRAIDTQRRRRGDFEEDYAVDTLA